MRWVVVFFDEFEAEFDACSEAVQDAILAKAGLLEREGRGSAARMPTR